MSKIRLRFAPSPTGYLHIGSLRTILFAYLITKQNEGDFILRIEDTDQKRKVEGAVEKMIEIVDWLGFKFDEGPHVGGEYGPYTQMERLDIYDKYKKELIEKDLAYPCFCTAERLQEMREAQQAKKLPPRYDRKCRDISKEEAKKRMEAGETYVLRQKMPLEGDITVNDELRGDIVFKYSELEDHVLIKSDGIPTYHFAVVIDDHLMEITHVLRGEEWIPSFPKHIALYNAFGWEAPKFIHVPLTLNKGGGKLSKRQGDVSVEEYQKKGYLQDALINFNVLLGWHPKDDNEILSMEDLLKLFDYNDINVSPSIFDIEKLDYFNGYYIRHTEIDKLVELCKPYLEDNLGLTTDIRKQSKEFIKKVVHVEQERLKKLSDIAEATRFFFYDKLDFESELLVWKKMTKEEAKDNLNLVLELIEVIPEENWTNDSIEDAIITYLQAKELKVGPYLWPMRVALSGQKASPGPFDIAEILGKFETKKRINFAIKSL